MKVHKRFYKKKIGIYRMFLFIKAVAFFEISRNIQKRHQTTKQTFRWSIKVFHTLNAYTFYTLT